MQGGSPHQPCPPGRSQVVQATWFSIFSDSFPGEGHCDTMPNPEHRILILINLFTTFFNWFFVDWFELIFSKSLRLKKLIYRLICRLIFALKNLLNFNWFFWFLNWFFGGCSASQPLQPFQFKTFKNLPANPEILEKGPFTNPCERGTLWKGNPCERDGNQRWLKTQV